MRQKGEPITEAVPFRKNFFQISRVSYGRPRSIDLVIYSDEISQSAPLTRDGNVKLLCLVSANLSAIPDAEFPIRRGVDGHDYYDIDCDIEAACECFLIPISKMPGEKLISCQMGRLPLVTPSFIEAFDIVPWKSST